MRFFATVIDLPRSMYTITDAPREVRRKIARILAICFAILVYEIYCSTIQKTTSYIAETSNRLTSHIYRLIATVIMPTLPRTIAI